MSLFVDDMGCRRCIREVTRRLRDVSGVQTVTVDTSRSVVSLTGTMTADDVLGAFAGLTYSPRLLDDPPFHGRPGRTDRNGTAAGQPRS
jgi:copper chaperone CopZ